MEDRAGNVAPRAYRLAVPVERWSPAQVAALAPDAGSVRAARGVAGPGDWQAAGQLDDILWGLCRGSAQRPYQVCVDLSGPAYRCSCPSRKVPCKHALGLLFRWADGGAGDGPAPEFAHEWAAARATRATGPRAPGTRDPVAAAKRAEQRRERVAAGMAELGQWLDDQVRQGLAGAAVSGQRPFDTMAARLVDAQAPAAASAVRRIGGYAGVGRQWADRMLGELGLLRLLVAAHDRLDTLPAPLAATVRTRIGFPVSAQDVLAGPRVRDRWQVLGRVEVDDGALITRRTWLRGAEGGRFALLLEFVALGQPFTGDVVPGTEVDADICFYPGALPMRALIAERYGTARPLTEPAGGVGLRSALTGWAAVLAAEPWRYDVPVLLAGVVPGLDGWLIDAAGEAMPLAPGHREPWWLLALAGGAPATVAAELSPSGLRPLAAWAAGRYAPAGEPLLDVGPARPPELPPDLLAAALVGTARRPWTAGSVTMGGRAVAVPGGGPAGLLEAAAVALVYRRAGVTPSRGHHPVPAAPTETERPLPDAAAARLLLILSGGPPGGLAAGPELLTQWLSAAARRGGIVPPEALPDLLDAGRRNAVIRPDLATIAGRRGAWLAGLREDWRWLLQEAPAGSDDPAAWAEGSTDGRVAYLIRLRARDAGAALELLAGSWAAESPEDRVMFLGALETGLSPGDDAFLDRALDDRRREVREAVLDLLRRLPGSSLGRRMAVRAAAAVRLEPPRLSGGERLVVEPPDVVDADLRRDGVGATPARGTGAAAWLLEEILAGTPLATWTARFGRPPGAILHLARGHDWEMPLVHGWARAAIAQRDAGWATALVTNDSHNQAARLRETVRWDLYLLLPPADLARIAAEFLRRDDHLANRLLALHRGDWPDELTMTVLDAIGRRARSDQHSWQLAELCRSAALAMPPRFAPHVAALAATLEEERRPVAELVRTLIFRHEILQEFA